MKIKEIIKNLHFFKSNNRKNISRNFSGAVEGSVWSFVSDGSLFQLILLLKVYRPLPMLSQC